MSGKDAGGLGFQPLVPGVLGRGMFRPGERVSVTCETNRWASVGGELSEEGLIGWEMSTPGGRDSI